MKTFQRARWRSLSGFKQIHSSSKRCFDCNAHICSRATFFDIVECRPTNSRPSGKLLGSHAAFPPAEADHFAQIAKHCTCHRRISPFHHTPSLLPCAGCCQAQGLPPLCCVQNTGHIITACHEGCKKAGAAFISGASCQAKAGDCSESCPGSRPSFRAASRPWSLKLRLKLSRCSSSMASCSSSAQVLIGTGALPRWRPSL